jgi:hypothetical protein
VGRPIINTEEAVGKVVGRRGHAPDPLTIRPEERLNALAWQRARGGLRVTKGVYRFRSHDDADEWLWRLMARPRTS